MNPTAIALSGYLAWTLLLLVSLVSYRTFLISSKQREGQGIKFNSDGSDVPDFGQRLTRAHANCVECFAFIGGIMLLALATDNAALTHSLAYVLLGTRIAQSVVHLISTSTLFIQLRFALFLVQLGICGYWLFLMFPTFTG